MVWIVLCIISTILLVIILDCLIIGFPKPVKSTRGYVKEYLLKEPNRMDFQKTTECSGFSSAHVFRSFGMEAEGNAIYARIEHKMKNGAVLPGTLKRAIGEYGYYADYVKGNLHSLKNALCEGKRVILLIKTRLDKNWLHYVSVVGYDEENIFIAESLHYLANCETEYYNRRLSNAEFMKYWDTREWYMPFYRNTYIWVDKK